MTQNMQFFSDMPTPLKAGLLMAGGATPLGILTYMNPQIGFVVFAGMAIVGVLMVLFWKIIRFFKMRKAAPFESGIIQQPPSKKITDPKKIADLDGLRRKFEEGIETFKTAGKNLYDFPWYLIVGEPGSGKTEAIRHCNIGFPPGLQDEFQGAGGTLNMNWWFTDHAVILDTAGRLLFEEVEAGQSSEWKEFLKLLKKSRNNCPINGVFLVIPADSLIKDTADEIEQKANKIARQFDIIQRALDVRFPVFVLITKSDLITGFRDFFENVQDPELQHQIFGWSNPGSLDEPYNPDFIEQHLKAIQGRLYRRRLALMQQMTIEGGEDKDLRQADALYSFPHSLKKLAPRMGRYLELIFSVGSQWSCKPLFFRGIYFTSAMQEGSALDAELAEALGISVDSLPDGRVWTRNRAYFLRDLFIRKVFQEKGLVTRATNASRQHTRRKAALFSAAIICVLILFSFTWLAYRKFRGSVGDLEKYITVLTEGDAYKYLKVIAKDYEYEGGTKSPLDNILNSEFHFQLAQAIEKSDPQRYPLVSTFLSRAIDRNQLNRSQRILYQNSVLAPFFLCTAKLLMNENEWKKENIEPLKQCILTRTGQIERLGNCENLLDPLQQYISSKSNDSWEKYPNNKVNLHYLLADKEELNTFIKQDYFWDSVQLWGEVDKAIRYSIDNLRKKYSDWQDNIAQEDLDLSKILELFNKYENEERELLGSSFKLDQWHQKCLVLQGLKKEIEEVLRKNEAIAKSDSLEKIYDTMIYQHTKEIEESVGVLLGAFPDYEFNLDGQEKTDDGDRLNYYDLYQDLLKHKNTLMEKIEKEKTGTQEKLRNLDEIFWGKINQLRKYEIRYQAYETADGFTTDSSGFQRLESYSQKISEIDIKPSISTYEELDYKSACRNYVICSAMDALPDNVEELKKLIFENDQKTNNEYDDTIVKGIKDPLDQIEKEIPDNQNLGSKFRAKKKIWDDYLGEYKKYWSQKYVMDEIEKRVRFSRLGISTWKDLQKISKESEIREKIKSDYWDVQEKATASLSVVGPSGGIKADDKNIMSFVDCWADLSSLGTDPQLVWNEIFNQIHAKQAVWKEKYCVYSTKSENFLIDFYRAAFAAEALDLLASDVGKNRKECKNKIEELAQYFPFNQSATNEISSEKLQKMKAGIENLLPSEGSKISGIELKIYDLETDADNSLKDKFKELQDRMNKTLNDFDKIGLNDSEIRRYRRIKTILDCMPVEDRQSAWISVIPAGKKYCKDSSYRGHNEFKRAFKINDQEMGDTSPGNTNLYELAYPNQGINIQVYQYTDYINLRETFTYGGDWAIFRMILDTGRFYRRDGKVWYLDYDLGEGDHLYLKIEFEKELPDLAVWLK